VIATPTGFVPTGIAVPAMPVARLIGVTELPPSLMT
jgi:hypothetical protein